MKKLVLAFLSLIGLTAFASSRPSNEELNQILKMKNAVGLDVRTFAEATTEPAPGSFNIPIDDLEARIETVLLDKNAPVLVFCRSGNRSAKAKQILEDLGYKNVIDIETWKVWNQLEKP